MYRWKPQGTFTEGINPAPDTTCFLSTANPDTFQTNREIKMPFSHFKFAHGSFEVLIQVVFNNPRNGCEVVSLWCGVFFCLLIRCTLIKKCFSLFSLCRGAGKRGKIRGTVELNILLTPVHSQQRTAKAAWCTGNHALNALYHYCLHYHTHSNRHWPQPRIDVSDLHSSDRLRESLIGACGRSWFLITQQMSAHPCHSFKRYRQSECMNTHTRTHTRHQMPPQLYCWLFAFRGCQRG